MAVAADKMRISITLPKGVVEMTRYYCDTVDWCNTSQLIDMLLQQYFRGVGLLVDGVCSSCEHEELPF